MGSSLKVRIRGEGIAAYCCAWLLTRAGHRVTMERTDRPRVPAIMLSDAALALIRDIFERPDLFTTLPRIDRRVVVWGAGAKPVELAHSAVVVSEALLLDSLRTGLTLNSEGGEDHADFEVLASRPLPPEAEEHKFGSRMASAVGVQLRDDADASACWIESFDEGWLFLIPQGESANWLLAVGAEAETLLASSRVIAPRIDLLERRSAAFAACPRIVSPLGGTGWLACGTAAMAFDPICGDGTAHAVREAILAVAVIRASAAGGDATAAMAHYGARLTAGFERHLHLCHQFYRTGGTGAWWQRELAALETGIVWCQTKAREHGEFRYRLDGFELIAV